MTEPKDENRGSDSAGQEKPKFLIPDGFEIMLEDEWWSLDLGVPFVVVSGDPKFALHCHRTTFDSLATPSSFHNRSEAPYPAPFLSWLNRASDAVRNGTLPVQSDEMKRAAIEGRLGDVFVRPSDCVAWFVAQVPKSYLPEAFSDLKPSAPAIPTAVPGHPVMDPAHPHHVPELATALRGWEELFMERAADEPRPPKGYRRFITDWLVGNCGHGQNAQERIATLINPHRSGGASKTP